MPVKIRFLLETKTPSVEEAIRWISTRQVDLTHWNNATRDRFAIFLRDTQGVYGFLEGARCVLEFERHEDAEFWRLVKNEPQSTASSVIHIDLSFSGFAHAEKGIKYFKAKCIGGGRWRLEGVEGVNREKGFLTAVYWLPYKAGSTTYEAREAFQNIPSVDFFMTFELSGCRFVVTDTHVFHVAFDAGCGGNPSRAGTATRDHSMNQALEDSKSKGRVRSLSILGDDTNSFGYGIDPKLTSCRAIVFGAKGGPNRGKEPWVYKAFLFTHAASFPNYVKKAWCVVFDKMRYAGDQLWEPET